MYIIRVVHKPLPICVFLTAEVSPFFFLLFIQIFSLKALNTQTFPVHALFSLYSFSHFSCRLSGALSKIYLPNLFLDFIVYEYIYKDRD